MTHPATHKPRIDRAEARRRRIPDVVEGCRECAQYQKTGGPDHYPSEFCRSGKRPHCSCGTCY